MKTGIRITGGRGLVAKFRQHPQLVARTTESVLVQEARALCNEYASATLPGPGLQDGGKVEAFRKTVEADIKRVFAIRSNPNQIFQMLKAHAPELAGAYWHAYKSKKPRSMAAILRKANLPQGLDIAAYKATRTGLHGRVKKNQRPISVANEASVRVLVRKQRALVGTAKAGWGCAAKALGGRNRRNLRDAAGGNRSTEEVLPAYVRAIMRKFPDLGGARVVVEGDRVAAEIFTNVKHAADAIPAPLLAAASDRAQQRVAAALTASLRELNARQFGSTRVA